MGRRPARRAPPAVPHAGARGRRDHPQGPHAARAGAGGLRAAHRAHQRRPRRPAASPRRWPPRSGLTDLAPTGPRRRRAARQARDVRARAPRPSGSATRWRRRARAGSATTTRARSPPSARAGSGRWTALRRRSAGRRARGGRRGAGRGGAARGRVGPRSLPAMLAAHPYEEPAYDVVELADAGLRRHAAPAGSADWPSRPRCAAFADAVAAALPATAHGVRVGGRPRPRRTHASRCAGARATSCSTEVARSDADVYVTSDLRHHPAGGVPRARAARRWSTSPTGRPSGPGCRWSEARLTEPRWAIRWRPG